MERSVEHRHLRQPRIASLAGLDQIRGRRIMKGRQALDRFKVLDDLPSDDGGPAEKRAAMNNPVPNRARNQRRVLCQELHDLVERPGMARHRHNVNAFPLIPLVDNPSRLCRLRPDSLGFPSSQLKLLRH